MRAGIFLKAFSSIYNISVVVPEIYRSHDWWNDASFLAANCVNVEGISGDRIQSAPHGCRLRLRTQPLVTHIHVFKLNMIPFIRHYLSIPRAQRPLCTLDLDDYESFTSRRISALAAESGCREESERRARWADYSALREYTHLPQFDQVYVCHQGDRARLQHDHPAAHVHVVPNAVRIPETSARQSGESFTFLFVGSLGYYPNQDAVVWFCSQILPLIRRGTTVPFRVVIVGGHAPESVQRLAALPELTLTGQISNLDDFYHSSSIGIAPIRAGGGTRIKILEAMAYGRPIVSTSIGAEGLDVHHGEQLLIGDTPDEFAVACLLLLHDAARREKISMCGLNWVKRYHSAQTIEELIRMLCSTSGDRTYETVIDTLSVM